jgi:hypothetical protein
MIKVLLNHFIAEKAIDVMFTSVKRNFSKPALGIRKGDLIGWMEVRFTDDDDIDLDNCAIKSYGLVDRLITYADRNIIKSVSISCAHYGDADEVTLPVNAIVSYEYIIK